jgi:hypothetical protein
VVEVSLIFMLLKTSSSLWSCFWRDCWPLDAAAVEDVEGGGDNPDSILNSRIRSEPEVEVKRSLVSRSRLADPTPAKDGSISIMIKLSVMSLAHLGLGL